jgi:ATP-dependent DNA helicase RecG
MLNRLTNNMMTLEELKKLVMGGENDHLEFKETTGRRCDACRTLCAFLNGNGGIVVFGVSRKGQLTGQLVSDSTRKDLAAEFVKFEPGVELPVEFVLVDDTHAAIVVRAQQGRALPYQYDGRAYRRIQSSTCAMTQRQYESMLAERGGFRSMWELEPNHNINLEMLDSELICETARMGVAYGRLDAMAEVTDPKRLLRKFGLMKGELLLNGAAVLFGRELVDYPQCYIRMARFSGTDKTEFVDSRNVQGNLFLLANEAVAFCFKHLNLSGKTKGRLKRDEALEIPVDALRESIINALAHRDYSNPGGSVSVAIFDDRVEIVNPGSFPPEFPLTSPSTSDDSFPHNPVMARILYLRKTIEAWGRGMGLIFSSCRSEGREAPNVEERNGCVRIVFKRTVNGAKSANKTAKSANKTAKSANKKDAKSANKTAKSANKMEAKSANKSTKSDNKSASDTRVLKVLPNGCQVECVRMHGRTCSRCFRKLSLISMSQVRGFAHVQDFPTARSKMQLPCSRRWERSFGSVRAKTAVGLSRTDFWHQINLSTLSTTTNERL